MNALDLHTVILCVCLQIPAKGFLPPKDYVRPTESSNMRKLPRIKNESTERNRKLFNASPAVTGGGGAFGQHGAPTAAQLARDASRVKTLTHIDDVLSSLNTATGTMVARKDITQEEHEKLMKHFAKPASTQLKGLITMVNDVVRELNE